MNYKDLKAALDILGIAERATLSQIKNRHRTLVKEHHPDQAKADGSPDIIRKINAAYELLTAYCESYRFCFNEEEFLEQVPTERLRRQFAWDPVWGGDEGEKEPDD